MSTYPIYKELIEEDINLDNLYLDANNPRFVGSDWSYVPENNIDSDQIQKVTRMILERDYQIDKLVMNMEVNGYLPIDRVVVKQFAENKYYILEGNRRICAAKILMDRYRGNPNSVNEEIVTSITSIPCLIYTGSYMDAAAIFQGLRHITGIREWSAFNKAKLLVNLMEEEELTLTEVGKRFGLTAHGAGQWVRGFYAFRQICEKSDFTTEINERIYPYCQELFNRSSISVRDWLQWDEIEKQYQNELHLNEFLSWLFPREEEDSKGEWEKRRLRKADDIRTLSYLITNSPTEFQQFRSGMDLEEAYSVALQKKYEEKARENIDPSLHVFEQIRHCSKALENIPWKIVRDEESKQLLFAELEKLEKLILEIKE
ncbi:hypothetical protein ABE504_26620 [Paenibacillus oryzisoli]|uniref:hypothetical protein n=1 Tax=Paenibacillus oryzisoli TaxID=1850517 RepID=UPI003D267C79